MYRSSFKFRQKFHTFVSVVILTSLALSLCAPFMTYAQELEPIVIYSQHIDTSNNVANNGTPLSASQDDIKIDWGCSPLKNAWAGCLTSILYTGMTWTASLSTAAGRFLNTVILKLVIEMSQIVGAEDAAGGAIERAWTIVRDVANVMLVFLTIFIGLATIVGSTGYGYKRLLFKVVLATLFVNFSITLTRIVIDTSNILALSILQSITGPRCLDPAQYNSSTNVETDNRNCLNAGIAGVFYNETRLQQLLGKGGLEAVGITVAADNSVTVGANDTIHKSLQWVSLLGTVLFLVMAFVFFLAAILIFIRFFVLTILMVLSPIGLVAWITGVGGVGSKWWHTLLNQAFFLPVMFLMWLLSLRMLEGLRDSLVEDADATLLAKATSMVGVEGQQDVAYFAVFIVYALTIALLLFSLSLAKRMGAAGAHAVINTGNTWAKKAGMVVGAGVGGATLGMAARVGRNTAGRWAQNDSESERLKNMVSNGNILQRNYARTALAGSKKLAGASFDARAIAGKDAQKWVGAGKKGGYSADLKAKQTKIKEEKEWLSKPTATVEEETKRDKAMQGIEKDHAHILDGGYKGRNAVTKLQADYDKALDAYTKAGPTDKAKEAELNRVEKELKAARDYMDTDVNLQNLKLSSSALTPAGQAQIDAMEKALGQNKEILEMRRARLGAETDNKYLEAAKARGENRGDAYLNNYSKKGYMRDFMTGLRKKTGKAARNEEMDKLFKKWKEEEEGATSSSPASPAPAPAPATTP